MIASPLPPMPSVRKIQGKILTIAKYVDDLCRKNGIGYCIAAGTALGAVRHSGFIPWDDDLDIYMTPCDYERFRKAFVLDNPRDFVLQEWYIADKHLEYAKVRLNGTTFVEAVSKDRKDIHQGIFMDIFILHKVPRNPFVRRWIWFLSKFTTLYALSKRNWFPKTKMQAMLIRALAFLPCRWIANVTYRWLGRYDSLSEGFAYGYWTVHYSFHQGLFPPSFYSPVKPLPFEDTTLLAPVAVKEMLGVVYGDYMTLPSENEREAAVHALFADTECDYTRYFPDAAPVNGCLQSVPLLEPPRPGFP